MCCWCRLSSCCCGLRPLGPGVHSLGVVALLLNLAILVAPTWIDFSLPLLNKSGYEVRSPPPARAPPGLAGYPDGV